MAREYIERALKTRREMLGNDHPSTGLSLINAANVYSALGDHARALALKERGVNICTRALGAAHPITATELNNLGGSYRDLGDHEHALVFAQRSLAIRRSVLGEEHPDTADSFANVSTVEASLGRHKLALAHALRALEILAKVQDPGHSRTLDVVLMVVNRRVRFGHADSAYRLLELWLKKLPLDHPGRATLTARLRELPVPPGRRKAPATSKRSRKRS